MIMMFTRAHPRPQVRLLRFHRFLVARETAALCRKLLVSRCAILCLARLVVFVVPPLIFMRLAMLTRMIRVVRFRRDGLMR